ncbi:MAG: PHB depolymerase family esterase [Chloroflexota bacterium]
MPITRQLAFTLLIFASLLGSAALAAPSNHGEQVDDIIIDLGRGPVVVHVPPSYNPDVPTPLILLLHGYTNTGQEVEDWWQLTPLADEYGFLYAHPDGTEDLLGFQFWNATNACCAFLGSADDSGYLQALVDAIKDAANVDPGRVYFAGHSNGGFMSHRMACDHSDTVAAIASLAGATWKNPADCAPAQPVHVLQIHGTLDIVIQYNGGCTLPGACYPSARGTVRQWAAHNGCDPVPDTSLPRLNLDATLPGDETQVARFDSNCAAGGSAELWTIQGGSHSPNFSDDFSRLVVEFLLAHGR